MNEKLDKISSISGEVEYPISKYKMDNCYTPNGKTYPLCKGRADNEECKNCNLYET
jgi:hypothetical protein